MPPPVSLPQRVVLIDKEWVHTLIGLPMQVPKSWWKVYKRDDVRLNAGTIVSINFDAPNLAYFQLECNGEIYAMQHNAVFLFADLDHAHYNAKKIHLPRVAPANPANKEGVIAPAKKKRTTKSVGNFKEDEEYDDNNYFATPPNRNNSNVSRKVKCNAARKGKHKKRKTTINPDLVFGAELEFGDADNDDNEGGNEMNDDDGPNSKKGKDVVGYHVAYHKPTIIRCSCGTNATQRGGGIAILSSQH
jgi:hypothetical protein